MRVLRNIPRPGGPGIGDWIGLENLLENACQRSFSEVNAGFHFPRNFFAVGELILQVFRDRLGIAVFFQPLVCCGWVCLRPVSGKLVGKVIPVFADGLIFNHRLDLWKTLPIQVGPGDCGNDCGEGAMAVIS